MVVPCPKVPLSGVRQTSTGADFFGTKWNKTDGGIACKLLNTWWPGTESNRRRQPFQGCALPSGLIPLTGRKSAHAHMPTEPVVGPWQSPPLPSQASPPNGSPATSSVIADGNDLTVMRGSAAVLVRLLESTPRNGNSRSRQSHGCSQASWRLGRPSETQIAIAGLSPRSCCRAVGT